MPIYLDSGENSKGNDDDFMIMAMVMSTPTIIAIRMVLINAFL